MKNIPSWSHVAIVIVSLVLVAASPYVDMKTRAALDSLSPVPRGWPMPFVEQIFTEQGVGGDRIPTVTDHLGNLSFGLAIINVLIIGGVLEGVAQILMSGKRADNRSKT